VLIVIQVFYCICEFCCYINDKVTVRKIYGIESFKISNKNFSSHCYKILSQCYIYVNDFDISVH
jgi:hypothetical protein